MLLQRQSAIQGDRNLQAYCQRGLLTLQLTQIYIRIYVCVGIVNTSVTVFTSNVVEIVNLTEINVPSYILAMSSSCWMVLLFLRTIGYVGRQSNNFYLWRLKDESLDGKDITSVMQFFFLRNSYLMEALCHGQLTKIQLTDTMNTQFLKKYLKFTERNVLGENWTHDTYTYAIYYYIVFFAYFDKNDSSY